MMLSDVCLSVVYIGPKSRIEKTRKIKIGTEVTHITRDSGTTFRVKRSPGCFGWLFKSSHYIMYINANSLYAIAQSKPLLVNHEYSWRKARWAPQA